MDEANVDDAEAAEQHQTGLHLLRDLLASPSTGGVGLHAQAPNGECALCGSGNEAEPLGWVVSVSHSVVSVHFLNDL